MGVREDLHRLVDLIPDTEGPKARQLLLDLIEKTGDPLLLALANAPDDDEPTSAEEDEGAAEAWQEYLQGKGRPWEEVRKDLGVE